MSFRARSFTVKYKKEGKELTSLCQKNDLGILNEAKRRREEGAAGGNTRNITARQPFMSGENKDRVGKR